MTDLQTAIAFFEAAHLDEKRAKIYSSRRQGGDRYAEVMIIDCKDSGWWYAPFIGVSFFARLHFSRYIGGEFLRDVKAVRLTNTRVLIGRGCDPQDIIIL